jgi:hypothetical protein
VHLVGASPDTVASADRRQSVVAKGRVVAQTAEEMTGSDPPPGQPPPGPYQVGPYPGAASTPPYPYYGPPGQPYGTPLGMPYPYQYQQARPTNALAITSFVIGIVAFLLCWIPLFDLLLAAPAFILGLLGLSRANTTGGSGKALAISGLVLGAVAMTVSLAFFIVLIAIRAH